jgi:hypothetical protein
MKCKEKISYPPILESVNNGFVKNSLFWDMTPRSPLKVNRLFGGTNCSYYLLDAGLFGSFFNPEDSGDTFLRNSGCLVGDYTSLYLRRQNPS